MRRTTVLLPDDLAALVEHERRRRDISTAEVIREALVAYLGSGDDQPRTLAFIGIGRSGQVGGEPGIAQRAEEILAREWTRDALAGDRDR